MRPDETRLDIAVARWVLGLLSGKELPWVACAALEAGLDSPALRRLAGELRPTMGEAEPLFEKALGELHIDVPTKSEAGLIVAKAYAVRIVEGSVSPYEGARRIWDDVHDQVEELKPQLDPFVYWASEYWEAAYTPARRAECEHAIRTAARDLVGAAVTDAPQLSRCGEPAARAALHERLPDKWQGDTVKRLFLLVALAATFVGGLAYGNWGLASLPAGASADTVVIEKAARRLVLMRQGQVLKSYRVSLGGQPIGPKEREGDERTPEGPYVIDSRNPNSAFHLSLHISYPNAADSARAAKLGVAPGGAIMIHGIRNGLGWLGRFQRLRDWTRGCVAVTNPEIEEIWRAVPDGTQV